MLELGNQHLGPGVHPKLRTGKQFYSALGVDHVSVDLNGKDGSVTIDLSKPILLKDWTGTFDIVTNAGTTEHIEPLSAQFWAFRNIHDALKPGGVAVHMIPDADAHRDRGVWGGHCGVYYRPDFFKYLAERNGYRVAIFRRKYGLCFAALIKSKDRPFMDEHAEFYDRFFYRPEGGAMRWKLYFGLKHCWGRRRLSLPNHFENGA